MARRPKNKEAGEGFAWSRFWSAMTTIGIALLFLALGSGVVFGLKPLERRSAQLSAGESLTIQILWPQVVDSEGQPAGTWLPLADQESILRTVNASLGTHPDPFSQEPLARLGNALAHSGWFNGIPRISRQPNSGIKIDGEWRIPSAVVRYQSKDYLIDHLGRLLPPVYPEGASTMKFISSPFLPPPKTPTSERDFQVAWPGEDIVAGLELLAVLSAQPWSEQVDGVDVSTYAKTSMLEVVTTSGTRVVWGGRPTKPLLGDISTPQKLANMNSLVRRHGRIDGNCNRALIYRSQVVFDTSASAESAAAQTP